MPKQVVLPVTTFWFNVSEHQAASPYLVGICCFFALSTDNLCCYFLFTRVLLIYNVYLNVVIMLRRKER